jgi:hypothetical protein
MLIHTNPLQRTHNLEHQGLLERTKALGLLDGFPSCLVLSYELDAVLLFVTHTHTHTQKRQSATHA